MMGPRQVVQGALFYDFSIEGFVPQDHPVKGIDRCLDLTDVRPLLAPYHSANGRPSIDPELMIRMLLLGWLVEDCQIEPHIPVWDKSMRTDGTFSREDFTYDPAADNYRCPAGNSLEKARHNFTKPRLTYVSTDGWIRYQARKQDCDSYTPAFTGVDALISA